MRKRFQCEQCKEKFINNSNLKVHMKVCTGKVKEFLCKKCGDIQHNKTDHLDHLARVHNINKKHSCPICHKQLKKTSDLKKHMATHSNQKPFACQVCGKRFKTESYVKVHMKLHFSDGIVPEELAAQSMAANAAQSSEAAIIDTSQNGAIDDSDRGQDSERNSELDVPTSEDFNGISAEPETPEKNSAECTISEENGIPRDMAEGQSTAQLEKEEVSKAPSGAEGNEAPPEDNPQHFDTPVDTPETPLDTPEHLDTPVDTPEGVNTPEGGSTSDEYEQDSLHYGKKDMYVAQMSVFRNSTEIV